MSKPVSPDLPGTVPGTVLSGSVARPAGHILEKLAGQTLAFYAKPLLGRWLKTFKQPGVLVLSDCQPELAPLGKKLRTAEIQWLPWNTLENPAGSHLEKTDLVIALDPEVETQRLSQVLALIKPGGALLLVSGNLSRAWQDLQAFLTTQNMADAFPVGFHPRGAVAWWPFVSQGPLLWLGKLVEGIMCFFPGRYELGLRFGQCWMIRALKRDDITIL